MSETVEYKVAIRGDKVFTRCLLIHWVGVIELFNQNAISGQDVWDSIVLFYPKMKIKDYTTSRRIDYILGLMSEIEWSRDNFSQTYSMSLKRIRSLLKKEIKQLNTSITDNQGNRNISIEIIPVS